MRRVVSPSRQSMARRVVGALVVAAAAMIAPASGGRAVVALDALDASNEVSGLFAFSYWWYGTIRQPPMKKVSPPSLSRRSHPIASASEHPAPAPVGARRPADGLPEVASRPTDV